MKHSNIIELYEVYEEENDVKLIFELVKGEELQTKVKSKGYFTEGEAAKVMYRLLQAVAFCHENGIIHRDIKPSNILLRYFCIERQCLITNSKKCAEGLKLIDFGLAITELECSRSKTICGSGGYIAPEIFLNEFFSPKSDIYSCGIVLYFMLAGELPFHAASLKRFMLKNMNNKITFIGAVWNEVSKEAKDFITELTHSNPEMRPTALEALENKWFEKYLKSGIAGGPVTVSHCNTSTLSIADELLSPKPDTKEKSTELNEGTSASLDKTSLARKNSLAEDVLLSSKSISYRQHALSGKLNPKPIKKSQFGLLAN